MHPPAAARRGAAGYEVFQKEDGAIKVMLEPLTLGLGRTVDR